MKVFKKVLLKEVAAEITALRVALANNGFSPMGKDSRALAVFNQADFKNRQRAAKRCRSALPREDEDEQDQINRAH